MAVGRVGNLGHCHPHQPFSWTFWWRLQVAWIAGKIATGSFLDSASDFRWSVLSHENPLYLIRLNQTPKQKSLLQYHPQQTYFTTRSCVKPIEFCHNHFLLRTFVDLLTSLVPSATNLPARIEVPANGKPASSPRPKQLTVRFSISKCVLMLSSGLMRNPVTSQPLATTPRMPVKQQLSVAHQYSEFKFACFGPVHENGLEILILLEKTKISVSYSAMSQAPGQRWKPEEMIMCCLLMDITYLTWQWQMSIEQWENDD